MPIDLLNLNLLKHNKIVDPFNLDCLKYDTLPVLLARTIYRLFIGLVTAQYT